MTWPHACVRAAEPLSNHTSFRIGGPAEFYAEPSSMDELVALIRQARDRRLPVTVISGGTNCLVADRGVSGLVLHLGKAFRTIQPLDAAENRMPRVRCGSAVTTHRLVTLASQHGWGGLDTLAGLPGQIGGAVAMNAQSIGQFVERVTLVTLQGELKTLSRDQIQFNYRYTAIEPGVIVEVVFRFPPADNIVSAARIHQVLCYRNSSQELALPSAGCAFKNPEGQSAGKLIDLAGLKGARIGDARVSARHANFIVNVGQATCDDVLSLMEHIQRTVADRFGTRLEPEVRLLGEPWKR